MWGGDGAVALDTLLFHAEVEEGLEIGLSGASSLHITAASTPRLGQGCRSPAQPMWEGKVLSSSTLTGGKSRALADLHPLEAQSSPVLLVGHLPRS